MAILNLDVVGVPLWCAAGAQLLSYAAAPIAKGWLRDLPLFFGQLSYSFVVAFILQIVVTVFSQGNTIQAVVLSIVGICSLYWLSHSRFLLPRSPNEVIQAPSPPPIPE